MSSVLTHGKTIESSLSKYRSECDDDNVKVNCKTGARFPELLV